jgi:hypothetical protein
MNISTVRGGGEVGNKEGREYKIHKGGSQRKTGEKDKGMRVEKGEERAGGGKGGK